MQHHVGIGVAWYDVMRDAHAAEPHMIAIDELMHIEAEAGANICGGPRPARLGA